LLVVADKPGKGRSSWRAGFYQVTRQLVGAGGVADDLAGARTHHGGLGDQQSRCVVGETGAQIVGSGQDHRPHLVDGGGPVPAGGAFRDHQRADRLDLAVASLRGPCRLSGQRGACCAERVERVGLALGSAGGAIGAVDLDHGDPGGVKVAGEPGAVAAGPFDPDALNGPETHEPVREGGVAGRCRGERLDSELAADRVERGGNVNVEVGVDTAGDDACLYDGHCHPFLR